jgi:protein involved in polysaccharide export with SLBB domain
MNLLRSLIAISLGCFLTACSNNLESIATKELMASLKQSHSYVMRGAVLKQGRYSLQDAPLHLRVSQTILRAGGFGSVSDKRHVVLRRGSGKLEQRLIVNVDAVMRHTDVDETDPVVKAGDVIIVYSKMELPVP